MFGGYGLSVDGMNVAIIAWDTLFLKTNPETEPRWLAAGAQAFVYDWLQQQAALTRKAIGDEPDPDTVDHID